MSKTQKKQAYRTSMPFDGGLSPSTERSVMPFNNVHTIQDVMSGKPYKMPAAGGSWSQDEIGNKNRGERGEVGENYKRKERDLDILSRMHLNTKPTEKWHVKVPGGMKEFSSFDAATKYQERMKTKGKPFSYVTRVAQTNRSQIISDSVNKTFKIEAINEVEGVKGTGSGFCVYPNYFITCAHVLADYTKGNIDEAANTEWQRRIESTKIYLTGNRQRQQAQVVANDLSKDIAILKSGLRSEPFSFEIGGNVGDNILSIGSPHGFDNNVSVGTLSALNRKVYSYVNAPKFMFFDLSVFEGNSGGPVMLETTGAVIGMVVLVVAKSGEYGLNAGIDSKIIKDFCTMYIDGFK